MGEDPIPNIPREEVVLSQLVLTEREGPVAIVTLNRPERHNSLVPAFLGEILAALEEIGVEREVRAVVLQANGRSFSTGGDVAGFDAHRDDLATYARTIVGLLNQVILALVELPQPIVAAVHGIVTGGSLGLVLGSDVVLVAPEASFTPYYCVVGFGPDGGWTAMLPDVIGTRRAAEVLLRNLTITAEQALAWGLANRLVPADRIHDEALGMAQKIAAKKPGSVRHTKRLLSLNRGDVAARLEAERAHFVELIETDEARQGIAAFLGERRR
jgi:2-(1,2-epoxy-1,2-dihydrophenyl)acetyl-CoA isomerase